MIYEDQGDMEKSLQFGLIAAHLNPSNTEEWVRLAEMSLEQDNIKQAVFCYTKGSVANILIGANGNHFVFFSFLVQFASGC